MTVPYTFDNTSSYNDHISSTKSTG